jgi:hypothetical protein
LNHNFHIPKKFAGREEIRPACSPLASPPLFSACIARPLLLPAPSSPFTSCSSSSCDTLLIIHLSLRENPAWTGFLGQLRAPVEGQFPP